MDSVRETLCRGRTAYLPAPKGDHNGRPHGMPTRPGLAPETDSRPDQPLNLESEDRGTGGSTLQPTELSESVRMRALTRTPAPASILGDHGGGSAAAEQARQRLPPQ